MSKSHASNPSQMPDSHANVSFLNDLLEGVYPGPARLSWIAGFTIKLSSRFLGIASLGTVKKYGSILQLSFLSVFDIAMRVLFEEVQP